ncbi:MAG: DUF89 family protein [Thermoplasmata archaeon]|nr:DUF89 family protein [Thermoplasmata archaeon]
MKMKPRCIPCLLNRIIFESELAGADEEKIAEIMSAAVKKIGELYNNKNSSAYIATNIHALAYEMLGISDPYKELKKRSNEIAIKLLPKVEKMISSSSNPVKTAMIASIAANSLDFGIAGSAPVKEMEKKLQQYMDEGLYHDDFDKMEKYFDGSIVYLTDNCGEAVFDLVVCRELKKKYGIKITLVPKKQPVLTDATYSDILSMKLSQNVDEIISTGGFAVGIDVEKMPEKLKDRFENASLIISKGMANYEALSEESFKPIAYLMRVKCKSIGDDIGMPVNSNIIKLYD